MKLEGAHRMISMEPNLKVIYLITKAKNKNTIVSTILIKIYLQWEP